MSKDIYKKTLCDIYWTAINSFGYDDPQKTLDYIVELIAKIMNEQELDEDWG